MKKPFKILAVVIGIFLCGVVIIVALGAFFVATSKDIPVTEGDKRLIVRAGDLVPYFEEYSPTEAHESFEKLRYIDRCVELNYEYDSPGDDEPYIAVTVTHDRTRSDAALTFSAESSVQRLGLKIADQEIDVEENNAFYTAGDRSTFADITYDGIPVGHLLVAQKGKTTYAFTITGFVMDDPTMWHELFDDRIARMTD